MREGPESPEDRDGIVTDDELRRGERFLAAYHLIEQALRRKWGDRNGKEGFRRLVDGLSDRDWVVGRFRDDLIEFSELRNAMVHERVSPGYLIAVPLTDTVVKIEGIAELVERPPCVYPRFKRNVTVFSPEDGMETVFRAMVDTGFTQFPVYQGTAYRGLLTDGGIAMWVARSLTQDSAALLGARVTEVLKSEKNPDRAKFISRRATVYEAEHLFACSGTGDRWRVSALLITENGMPEESLLGIVTPSDILAYGREYR